VSAPVAALLVLLGLIVSAQARLNAVLLGQHVSVPVLGLVAVAVVLALAAVVLALVRTIVRDRAFLYLRPRMARL
jgi:uncharacterized membrane protein (DUF106 family)